MNTPTESSLAVLVDAFGARNRDRASCLYWTCGPRGWTVHVPTETDDTRYDLFRSREGESLSALLLRALGDPEEGVKAGDLGRERSREAATSEAPAMSVASVAEDWSHVI